PILRGRAPPGCRDAGRLHRRGRALTCVCPVVTSAGILRLNSAGHRLAMLPRDPKRLAAIFLLPLALMLWVQWDIAEPSPTMDEKNHLTRGMAVWIEGDTRFSYSHPPLANALAALPGYLTGYRPDLRMGSAWEEARVGKMASKLAYSK